jgi:hypothetical protein
VARSSDRIWMLKAQSHYQLRPEDINAVIKIVEFSVEILVAITG